MKPFELQLGRVDGWGCIEAFDTFEEAIVALRLWIAKRPRSDVRVAKVLAYTQVVEPAVIITRDLNVPG